MGLILTHPTTLSRCPNSWGHYTALEFLAKLLLRQKEQAGDIAVNRNTAWLEREWDSERRSVFALWDTPPADLARR
jgi:hypothetical protein